MGELGRVNMSSFPPRCYYYDSKNFGSVNGYERHIVTMHPNLPVIQDLPISSFIV